MRPEAFELARDAGRVAGSRAALSRPASRACCSTARIRRCWCAKRSSRAEFRIALPQTGRFADLRVGETIAFGFEPAARRVLRAQRGRWQLTQPRPMTATRQRGSRWLLLLAPALLWLVGLIVLPHVELAVLSLRARVAPRVYELGLDQYRDVLRRAAVLAHVRAHGRDVDPRDGAARSLLAFPGRRGTSPRSRAGRAQVDCCSCCA